LSPLIWTYGKYLESPSSLNGRTITQVVTPPFVANILAITLVMLRLNDDIPGVIVESAELLGRATVPVATFILGATLGTVFMRLPSFNEIIKVSVVKFVLMPAMMIGILYLLDLGSGYPLLADFLVIQAASAPATAHILIARTYGGDIDRIGGIIFVSYFITIIAIPFWLAVWRIL
jgi:predicted permease